ncbi:MAG: zinc ribbon domain-containing protein [Lachnospiraceae bacterium]|nr:zinc ribbon domain-containing protein [Lachnospiraceae bacterium]
MKNFFKNLLGKIFPHGVIGDDNNINDVYAGPDDMDKWKKKKKVTGKVYAGPENLKKKEMRCVYAGPEYFEKQRKSMEGVYAGPEEIEKREPKASEMEDVYMGPPEDEEVFSCVYMGPPEDIEPVETIEETDEDIFEEETDEDGLKDDANEDSLKDDPDKDKPEDDADKKELKEDKDGDDLKQENSDEDNLTEENKIQSPMGFVYAGPGYEKSKAFPMGMLTAVYAGPVNENSNASRLSMFLTAYAGPSPNPNSNMMINSGVVMNPLGQPQDQNAQNCTIGADAVKDLKIYKKCPMCGEKCYETQKFCNNCGRGLDDVEVTDESKNE